jgi:hypothetical protein
VTLYICVCVFVCVCVCVCVCVFVKIFMILCVFKYLPLKVPILNKVIVSYIAFLIGKVLLKSDNVL